MAQITLHGGPAIVRDGVPAPVPAPARRQSVLALGYLALHVGDPTPWEVLADVCWPAGQPDSWPSSLRRVVSDLRAWLRAADAAATVVAEHGAVRIDLRGDRVDVQVVHDLLDGARGDDLHEALASTRTAERMTRAPLLPGYDAPHLDQARRAALEQRLGLLERLAELECAVGSLDAALAAATAAVELEPLRETAHRLVMAVHHRAGRSGAALRAYETCRLALARELGASPSTETVLLYQSILHSAGAAARAAAPPVMADGRSAGRIMAQVKREEEVQAIEAQLVEADLRPGDPGRRVDLLIALGRAQWVVRPRVSGVLEVALAACEAALADGRSDQVADAFGLLSVCTGVGRANAQAERLCAEALRSFPGSPAVAARVGIVRAESCVGPDAIAAAEEAVAAARASGDGGVLLDALISLDRAMAWTPDLVRRTGIADECRRLADSAAATVWRLRPTYEAATRSQAGDVDWLAQEGERLADVAARSGQHEPAFFSVAYRGISTLLRGDVPVAAALADQALAAARDDVNSLMAGSGLWMAVVREHGGIAEVLPAVQAVASSNAGVPAFAAAAALALVLCGAHGEAAAALGALVDDLPQLPRDLNWLLWLGAASEAVGLLGIVAPAVAAGLGEPLLAELEPYAGQVCAGAQGAVVLGAVDLFRGMLLHGQPGRADEAVEALERAKARHRAMGAPLLEARTAAWLATTLLCREPERNAAAARRLAATAVAATVHDGRAGLAEHLEMVLPAETLAQAVATKTVDRMAD